MKIHTRFWVTALLAAFLGQGLFLIQRSSPTTDEVAFHMVNGYAYLVTRDYRMSPANPPLVREWMALPWLLMRPTLDLEKKSWKEADSVPFAVEFFYKDNRAIANRLLYSARFMILLLGLALGILIYRWAKELYGELAGVLGLALYLGCPVLLAHASIAHTDIGVTFFCALGAYFLWRYLEHSKTADLWKMAFALGLAFAAKYNALYFWPVFLAILLFKRGWRAFGKAFLVTAVAGFFVVWASYFFEFKPLLGGAVPRVDEKLAMISKVWNNEFVLKAARELPIPAPSYLLGVAGIVRSHQTPYLHYAFGEWTTKAVWYHYLFSFATKMTLPFLAFLGLRLVFWKKASSKTGHENAIVLLPTLAIFLLTFSDTTGVGVRYLFPVIPLLIVWIGGLARLAQESKRALGIGVALLVLNMASMLAIFPNYLSYFNEAVGGVRGGHRYVRGSDVDWGQGLKGLKRYLDKNQIEKVTLRYFGTADPSFYGIVHEPLSREEEEAPSNKVYAISLFNLEHARWTRELAPTAMIDGSIFVYDLRREAA